MSKTIAQLQADVRAFSDERQWGRFHSPRNLAMALSVETGELLELFLWSEDDGPQPPVAARAEKVSDEVADVLMCLLNFCDRSGIDLEAALKAKLAKAAKKYPTERVKGKALKYDEYAEWKIESVIPERSEK